MTLDRNHLSPGAWLMMLACPAFMGKLGLGLLLTPTAKMIQTPAFRSVDAYMPLKTLAVICVGIAALQVAALIVHRRSWYESALGVMVIAMVLWTVAFTVSFFQGQAPVTAMDWPAFGLVAVLATLATLERSSA